LVRAAYEAGGFDGVGLVHLPEDELTGIDFDKCRDPWGGDLHDWAARLVATLDTYAEASPSGTGARSFAFGKKPGTRCKQGPLEMYDGSTAEGKAGGRFLTVTGHRLPGAPTTLNRRQPQIDALYHERIESRRGAHFKAETDEELIARARRAQNGRK